MVGASFFALPMFEQRQARLGIFSSKQVLEISSNLEDWRPPGARSHPRAVIHYPRILHRRQLALEGNELMNMHRLVLINYASHSRRPGRRLSGSLPAATEGLLTRTSCEAHVPGSLPLSPSQ